MIIDQVEISNFRSFDRCTVDLNSLQAIVGRNNVGKSNLLKAIQLFMEASKRLLNEDCFHHHNVEEPIIIRVRFTNLNEWEQQKFDDWLYDDDTLIVERKFERTGEDSYNIDRYAVVREPEPAWLKESEINGENIKEWWEAKEDLTVNGLDFGDQLGTSRPQVGEWEEIASEFVSEHRDNIPFEEVERTNPRGYKGVLKGGLPEFILIPAVREVSEASKITKTSPFGQLINSVLSQIAESRRETVKEAIDNIGSLLNRGEDRLPAIDDFEEDLNDSIQEVSDIELEIAIDTPDIDDLLETAEVYARDGARTPIEAKGHGLQRSTIFTILRVYSNFATQEEETSKSTIFAFEEPEIYQHPQSQRTLLSAFRDIADSGDQVLYTTHSSHFVNVSRFDEVCIMRKEGGKGDFCTVPTQVGMDTVLEDLQRRHGKGTRGGIRNQYANAFDARISEGFFADKVVLVEGQSEKYILPIYARLLGYDFDRNNVAIVYPGTGKGQLDRLIRIFAGFDIPIYLIFDDDGNVGSKSIELAGLMGKDLTEVNSIKTTIGDKLTVFEGEIEDVLEEEIDEYRKWSEEVKQEWGKCGKPLRHRYMAVQIEERINNGASPEEVIPQSIQQIVKKVSDLNTSVNVFERGTDGQAMAATIN